MNSFSQQRVMMVDTQIRPSDVTKFPIIEAMLAVEREKFVPDTERATAYRDGPVPLNQSRSMLEPRILAKLLDTLNIQRDEMVLDIGAGLGYSSAVMARMAEAVIALEEDEELASEAETILASAEADNVAVVSGKLAQGAAQHGPYDVIVIQGGIETLPEELQNQVKIGGRIAAIFVEGALGVCRIGIKTANGVNWRDSFNASAEILPEFSREFAFEL